MMKKVKAALIAAIAGLSILIAGVATILVSVVIVPLFSMAIGYWIGFVAEWLAADWVVIGDLPQITATVFFFVSAITMLIKTNVQGNQK